MRGLQAAPVTYKKEEEEEEELINLPQRESDMRLRVSLVKFIMSPNLFIPLGEEGAN